MTSGVTNPVAAHDRVTCADTAEAQLATGMPTFPQLCGQATPAEQLTALSRLERSGWTTASTDDPVGSGTLVLQRVFPAFVDWVRVDESGQASAIRRSVLGRRLRMVGGSCAEVVAEVSSW